MKTRPEVGWAGGGGWVGGADVAVGVAGTTILVGVGVAVEQPVSVRMITAMEKDTIFLISMTLLNQIRS
jgi:hypothetical protein